MVSHIHYTTLMVQSQYILFLFLTFSNNFRTILFLQILFSVFLRFKTLSQSWHKVGANLHKVGSVLPMTTRVPYDKIELSEGEGAFRKQKILSPTRSKTTFIARSEYDEIYFIKEVFYVKRGTNLGEEQSHP